MSRKAQTDLGLCTATELAELYRSGEASPVDATRAALARIERFNPGVNAYTYVDEEGALKAARASASRWGQGNQRSPLDGVPVSLKDLTDVKGMPSSEGSSTSGEGLCDSDAPPAEFLREAGAVLLGQTNTPEFGWKAVTDNPRYGTTLNPWDTRLTAGGSSGGAAVAAALNMGALHQGGDSGGSIRIPAAFTGVFGFKPTFGVVPQWPPSKMASLSQIGPLTRTVEDAVAMLKVIGRYHYRDAYAIRAQPEDWGYALKDGLKGFRIAFTTQCNSVSINPEIEKRLNVVAKEFEKLGATVERIDPPFEDQIEVFRALWFIASEELCSQMSDKQLEQMDPGLRACAERAKPYRGLDLFRAQVNRALLTEKLEHLFQDYDLLLSPSVPIPPFEASDSVPPESGMRDWMEWTPYTYPFNLSEQPAASVPCGFTKEGLPIGFQVAAGKYDDLKVLRASYSYMDEHPPHFPESLNENLKHDV
ncbi:amidase [Marinobacter nanhaiticus D15-8W]|uniref:Amidase n=1 Tax=Marinobacter nanhaiticus D15-8W TaxID=626887 RepID=N6VRK6_9GAMM|nr:amidase [Marinobacter nanhaiticus]ENO12815.1 amidase [Marinobacter nanhaiticus D15-8W]BES70163.1 amidase [Marinobacter nanhaiticus D15-8W]